MVVGPKDLPRLMHMAGKWAGKARAMANEFRRSFDEMARQAELDELRKEIEDLKKNNPITEMANSSRRNGHGDVGARGGRRRRPDRRPKRRPPWKAISNRAVANSPSPIPQSPDPISGFPVHEPVRNLLRHDGRAVIQPTPEDEAALDATKAPLMEHLLELRRG